MSATLSLNTPMLYSSLDAAVDNYAYFMTKSIFPMSDSMAPDQRVSVLNTYARVKSIRELVHRHVDKLSAGTLEMIMVFAWLYGQLENQDTFTVIEMTTFEIEAAKIIQNIRLESGASIH